MVTVDAHQHFWDPATADYPWMSDAVAPLCRRFGPEDLAPLMQNVGIDQSIFVQARSDLAETQEYMLIAANSDFLAGVVGWVDLTDPEADDVLSSLRARPEGRTLVGIRHQVEDEPDHDWLVREDVRRGLEAVQRHELVYDLLLRPPNLPSAIDTVRAFPGLRFVVDHIAKPLIKAGVFEPWETSMRELAQEPNTWCKISGLVTEADRNAWKPEHLAPYVERVLDMFGTDRILYGSDWPVCLLANASYEDALESTLQALPPLNTGERDAFLGSNAIGVYRLSGLTS